MYMNGLGGGLSHGTVVCRLAFYWREYGSRNANERARRNKKKVEMLRNETAKLKLQEKKWEATNLPYSTPLSYKDDFLILNHCKQPTTLPTHHIQQPTPIDITFCTLTLLTKTTWRTPHYKGLTVCWLTRIFLLDVATRRHQLAGYVCRVPCRVPLKKIKKFPGGVS